MILTVERDGKTAEVDVPLDFGSYTEAEANRVVKALGAEQARGLFLALRSGEGDILSSPDVLRVLLWAKVATVYPEVTFDGFTLDMDDTPPVPIPMEPLSG